MIDSHILMLYTDALYGCPEESRPTYNEFRDMFSRGQLHSKMWLVEELYKVNRLFDEKVIIVGSWFAVLGYMIRTRFVDVQVICLDIDPRCATFVNCIVPDYQPNRVQCVTADLYEYNYTEDIIINTCCDDLTDLKKWFAKIPSGKVLALQSSNYKHLKAELNCVSSLAEFKQGVQSEFSKILFEGEMKFSMYTRYMVIGVKN
jgi:hypothetical protein